MLRFFLSGVFFRIFGESCPKNLKKTIVSASKFNVWKARNSRKLEKYGWILKIENFPLVEKRLARHILPFSVFWHQICLKKSPTRVFFLSDSRKDVDGIFVSGFARCRVFRFSRRLRWMRLPAPYGGFAPAGKCAGYEGNDCNYVVVQQQTGVR
jgi:hypothetical protein